MHQTQILAMKFFCAFTLVLVCVYRPAAAQQLNYSDSIRYYTLKGQTARAFIFAKENFEALKNSSIADSAYIAAARSIANFYYSMVKPDSALAYYEKACEGAKIRYGASSTQYGALLLRTAIMNCDLGQYQEAEQRFQNATVILSNRIKNKKREYVHCLVEYAAFHITTGNLNRAEELCDIACETALRKPVDSVGYTSALEKLARLYYKMGFYDRQEAMIIKIYEIYKAKYGSGHYKYIHAIVGMGDVYQRKQNLEKADSVYRKALEITQQALGNKSPANIYLLRRIGIVNTEMRKYEIAENYLKEALEIVNENGGEASPLYPMCGNNLARLYAASGRKELATLFFEKTLAVYDKLGLTMHASRLSLLYDMGDLLSADEPEKATVYLKEAMNTEHKLLLEKLDFLSETELLTYLKGIKEVADAPYRLLLQHKSTAITGAAYNSRLLMGGIGLQNTRALYQNMAQSKDSVFTVLWKNFLQQKYSYKNLLLTPVSKRSSNTDSVATRLSQQEKELLRRSADYRNMKEQLAFTWQDVQKHLQPGETAIEFVKFNGKQGTYGNDKDGAVYYAALLLRTQDTIPQFVVLCRENLMSNALKKFPYKAAVGNSRGQRSTGNIQRASNILYQLIWHPLEPYLANTKTIYFSPAGMLHRVAFAAIPYTRNMLLSDQYNLVQLASTRQVALQESRPPAPVSIAMFGGINYNSAFSDNGGSALTATNHFVYPNSRGADVDSFRFLPNTLTEINAIKAEAETAHKELVVFTGVHATEAVFRNLTGDNSPEVIHFATHGFTFSDTAQSNNAGVPFKASDNPLLRCGLVMAGGNKGWKGKALPDEDDGILTGMEISAVQLPHTKLAVLSACETGLGKIEGSEGVFGLQRAFKLAGVKYVMASLWQVPDKETAEFMETFYAHWLGGKTIRGAFLTAQQLMRKKYAPYFWAGFTLVQ